VTDRIASNELSVEWCPTGEMIADFMTKPLQGALFKKFRDLIMGVISTTSPTQAQSTKVMSTAPIKTKKDGGCTQCGTSNVKTDVGGRTQPGTSNDATKTKMALTKDTKVDPMKPQECVRVQVKNTPILSNEKPGKGQKVSLSSA
jgi:hypothetical protein